MVRCGFYFIFFRILCGRDEADLNFKPKLYRVKGKRAPITTELASLDWSNFSSKDVYVVHTERIIFIWIGRAASATEKLHAIKVGGNKKHKPCCELFVLEMLILFIFLLRFMF